MSPTTAPAKHPFLTLSNGIEQRFADFAEHSARLERASQSIWGTRAGVAASEIRRDFYGSLEAAYGTQAKPIYERLLEGQVAQATRMAQMILLSNLQAKNQDALMKIVDNIRS